MKRRIKWGAVAELVESHGAREVAGQLVEASLLPEDHAEHLDLDEGFSIRAAWETFVGPVSRTLEDRDGLRMLRESAMRRGMSEAADPVSAFTTITGEVIRSRLIKAYKAPAFIGDRLVRSEQYNKRDVKIAGLENAPNPEVVQPGQAYQRKGIGTEIYATAQQEKQGFILEVDEDLIMEDQTGQLLGWARQTGARMGRRREKRILNGVQDVDSDVFRPQGSAEALYRTSAGTNSSRVTKTAAKALTDWTDINEALLILAAFKENRDQTGEYVGIPSRLFLLVPMALRQTALRIANATLLAYGNYAAASPITSSPNDPIIQNLEVLWSPLLDAQSADTWYLGDVREQFVWVYKYPLQVQERMQSLESWWNRDVLLEIKAREYGDIMAEDDCYVVQCPGS